MTKTEQQVEKIVMPIVESLGYELYDVEYLKEGTEWYLRLFIDRPEGIDLDNCEKVSRAVEEVLDKEDPISTGYNLEVSSCGLEKNLREEKHFISAIGKEIELKLYKQIEKEKELVGILKEYKDSALTIEKEGKEIGVDIKNVASAKILYNWEDEEK